MLLLHSVIFMTIKYNIISYFFFFLNHQFITQGMRADHGSYFVTMYIQNKATWKRKGREER